MKIKNQKNHNQSIGSQSEPLTTYKKDVDKFKKLYYGLHKFDYKRVEEKIKKQTQFLKSTYLYDYRDKIKIPLSKFVISSNHNPNRYYAQIQNRVHTLISEAEEKNLVPLFLTITLPSEFHEMKIKSIKDRTLVYNHKYNKTEPKEAVKVLTKMFARLRHDRSLKELSKSQRIYFRVNEPHKDGTPHTHILLYIPKDRVTKVIEAFNRLYPHKSNKIENELKNAGAYVMKYINKTLPLSKKDNLTQKDRYLNAWYSKHRIIRFNSSQTLAPLRLYRLLHKRLSLKALTKAYNNGKIKVMFLASNTNKIMEIFDNDELVYIKNENLEIIRLGQASQKEKELNNLIKKSNYLQKEQNDTPISAN
jgi:hypothetical protein